jgi:hypothetical protein
MFYYCVNAKSMLIFQIGKNKNSSREINKFEEYKSDLRQWMTQLYQLDKDIQLYFIFIVHKETFKNETIDVSYNIVYMEELVEF